MKEVRVPAEIEALATQTVHAALTVHRTLGPGLLESAYQQCLAIELGLSRILNLDFQSEIKTPRREEPKFPILTSVRS
jgi:GxxExxY protein